jgi:hypothetical protein
MPTLVRSACDHPETGPIAVFDQSRIESNPMSPPERKLLFCVSEEDFPRKPCPNGPPPLKRDNRSIGHRRQFLRIRRKTTSEKDIYHGALNILPNQPLERKKGKVSI